MSLGISAEVIISAVILVLTYIITYGFSQVVMRAIGGRSRSSAYEIGRVGSMVIWTIGILAILPVLGASETVIAVVILLVGAFLILATRDLSNNWFAGEMIRAIEPFKIGDWVRTADGSYGRVTGIEGLYTLLVTPRNEIIVIPNSKLTSDLLVDRTKSGSLKVPVDLELNRNVEFGELSLAVSKVMGDLSQDLSDSGPKSSEPEMYLLSTTPNTIKVRVFLRIDNAAREEEIASEFRKRFNMLGLER